MIACSGDDEVGVSSDDGGDGDVSPSCDDGWSDAGTGLCWQTERSSQTMNVATASAYCAALSDDESKPWRLPQVTELRTLVSCPGTAPGGACTIGESSSSDEFDASCQGCSTTTGCAWDPALGACGQFYWSSSVPADYPDHGAWMVDMLNGGLNWEDPSTSFNVICVR